MLPIYICEDEQNIRNHLVNKINDYIMIQEYDMKIVCDTENPQYLLDHLEENKRGIYFLDIDLKNDNYDGFTLAKEIRKKDEKGFLIFVTTHGEMTFETFRLHLEAMDYIVKDQEGMDNRIRFCLDTVQKRILNEDSNIKAYYSIKANGAVYHFLIDAILYIETAPMKHRLIIHTDEDILEFSGNLNQLEEKLPQNFMRVHRSYLINCNRISQIHLKENIVELDNGEQCIVSRRMKKKLTEYKK